MSTPPHLVLRVQKCECGRSKKISPAKRYQAQMVLQTVYLYHTITKWILLMRLQEDNILEDSLSHDRVVPPLHAHIHDTDRRSLIYSGMVS